MTALVQQVDPQSVVLHFSQIAAATKGVLKTDLPQSELGTFAELALKARAQKIRSVNFVPPLIKPWSYDPAFVTSTVKATIAASEKASSTASRATSTGSGASAAAKGSAAPVTPSHEPSAGTVASGGTPSAPANSDTSDLSGVCSAG
jgi:hypothetical protein